MPQVDRIQIYRGRRGLLFRTQYRARVLGGNNRILWVTPEGYNNLGDLTDLVTKFFPSLPLDIKE